MNAELKDLLFDAAHYRSKLRVARLASLRLAARAAQLLGEVEP